MHNNQQEAIAVKQTQPSLEHVKIGGPELPALMCHTNDMTKHTLDDQLSFYDLNAKYLDGNLGPAVPSRFQRLRKAIHSNELMIRRPTVECIGVLEAGVAEDGPTKILISGPDGGGKSLTLLQVMQWGLMKNMLMLYIPSPYMFLEPAEGELVPSSWKPTRFDQPKAAKRWLDMFKIMNKKFLETEKTTREYKFGRRDITAEGKPLAVLLEQGTIRDTYITDSLGILLREIRLNKKLNVMWAVDGVNGLFSPSNFKIKGERVDPQRLALIEYFSKFMKPQHMLSKGVYAFAASRSVSFFQPPENNIADPIILEQIFSHDALGKLNDFVDIHVPHYSEEEYLKMMEFYKLKGWIGHDLSDDFIKQIRFVTDYNPRTLAYMLRSL